MRKTPLCLQILSESCQVFVKYLQRHSRLWTVSPLYKIGILAIRREKGSQFRETGNGSSGVACAPYRLETQRVTSIPRRPFINLGTPCAPAFGDLRPPLSIILSTACARGWFWLSWPTCHVCIDTLDWLAFHLAVFGEASRKELRAWLSPYDMDVHYWDGKWTVSISKELSCIQFPCCGNIVVAAG